MEVHHHPNLHHQAKPWKEYLLEFLMIFLAVTLGFFAENIREYISEGKKAKEYVLSFKEDLIKDTNNIDKVIVLLKKDISGCDSLNYYLVNDRIKTATDLQKIYQFNLSALGGFGFTLTDRTSSQLKNSGGMRLLSNKKIINGILDYWETGLNLSAIQTGALTMRYAARQKTYLIFDNKYYINVDGGGRMNIAEDAKLMTDNYLQLTELRNRLNHFRNLINSTYITNLINQKHQAKALIELIEKEYE